MHSGRDAKSRFQNKLNIVSSGEPYESKGSRTVLRAAAMVTTQDRPLLIVYCILRSIPNKTGGVLAIGLVFVALLALPFIATSPIRSSNFRPYHRKAFYLFVSACLVLSWAGSKPVEQPYIFIGQTATIYFFLYFFLLVPALGRLEYYLLTRTNK
jgi:quinol-cytochrome oxidoreductase complex cytochrome b subunit